jgi:hypothetical protein
MGAVTEEPLAKLDLTRFCGELNFVSSANYNGAAFLQAGPGAPACGPTPPLVHKAGP